MRCSLISAGLYSSVAPRNDDRSSSAQAWSSVLAEWLSTVGCFLQEQFEQDYAAVQRLALMTNYRSTPSIVAHSNSLIACNYQNSGRGSSIPKTLRAAPGIADDNFVQFVRYRSKESQGDHILSCVNWWHTHGKPTYR